MKMLNSALRASCFGAFLGLLVPLFALDAAFAANATTTLKLRCDLNYTIGTGPQYVSGAFEDRRCSASVMVSRVQKDLPLPALHFPVSCKIPAGKTNCEASIEIGLDINEISTLKAYSTPSLTDNERAVACNYVFGNPEVQTRRLSNVINGVPAPFYAVNVVSQFTCSPE